MENINQQPVNTETTTQNNTTNQQMRFPLVLGIILLLLLVGVGSYYLGMQKGGEPFGKQPVPTSTSSPTISDIDNVASPTPKVITPITIPSDWKQYTATDGDFGIKTTMSLPPGFSFQFTGSEFLIRNSDSTELWDYSTSVYIVAGSEDLLPKNHYNSDSRRTWYENYLSGKIKGPSVQGVYNDKIVNVEEIPINATSYLAVTVEASAYNDHGEISGTKKGMHYVYVQNNILHMITPASNKAYTAKAQIPKYIGTIFASLTSSQIK